LIDQTLGAPYAALFPHKVSALATAAAVVDPDDATGTHAPGGFARGTRTLHVTPPQRLEMLKQSEAITPFPDQPIGAQGKYAGYNLPLTVWPTFVLDYIVLTLNQRSPH
jgi:hypothetical protein